MDLAILARINQQFFSFKKILGKGDPVTLSRYLDARLVLFLNEDERDAAIERLVDQLASVGSLKEKEKFYQAILDREGIVSTGIGFGVAIPHAKLKQADRFMIAIGVHRGEGVEWNALDGRPVRLIFLIGGPEDKPTEYLKILSQLTQLIKNDSLRKQLLQAQTAEEVISLLQFPL